MAHLSDLMRGREARLVLALERSEALARRAVGVAADLERLIPEVGRVCDEFARWRSDDAAAVDRTLARAERRRVRYHAHGHAADGESMLPGCVDPGDVALAPPGLRYRCQRCGATWERRDARWLVLNYGTDEAIDPKGTP